MKNIDYLELFFKKHNLSGKIKVKFSSQSALDEYMTDIVFENGDVVNINDIIFDIESEFPSDVYDKWIEAKKESGISLMDWVQTDIHYIPKDMDTSSVEYFQKEMTTVFDEVKQTINKVFEFEPDDGDSDGSEVTK